MKRTIARLALTATLLGGLGATAVPAASASTSVGSAAPKYCAAFSEYYEVQFAIAIVTGFAEAFAEEGDELSAAEARNVVYLVLSPKLEPLTADLAKSAPRATRKLFALQAKVYGKGVELLSDLGLSDTQLEQIADQDLAVIGSADEFTQTFEITKAQIIEAAGKLANEIEKAKGAVDPTPRQEKALDKLALDCGTTPDDSIDCDTVFPESDVEALIGPVASTEGSCIWEAEEPDTGLTPRLAVQVFRSVATYEARKESNAANGNLTEVTGVGEEAFVSAGFTSQTSGSTCGKTIYVNTGDDTVMVSICPPDDAEPSDEEMVQLATDVLERLDA